MAHTGPEPAARKLGRTPNADWTEVEDKPFTGKPPVALTAKVLGERVHPLVASWWKTIARMPHCKLWTEADWLYAFDTAVLKQQWYRSPATANLATEIRRREDQMGTTLEARRKLRIRYVTTEPPAAEKPAPRRGRGKKAAAPVVHINERRARLSGNAS